MFATQTLRDAGRLHFVAAQPTGITQQHGRLTGLVVQQPDGAERTLPLDALLVLTGLSPRLGPIANWGLHSSASRSSWTRRSFRPTRQASLRSAM